MILSFYLQAMRLMIPQKVPVSSNVTGKASDYLVPGLTYFNGGMKVLGSYKLRNNRMEQSMSRVGHCIDNGPTEGLWGIIKSEMYCMYKITDENSLRSAIDKYMKFYAEKRPQERFLCKTPSEVRIERSSIFYTIP